MVPFCCCCNYATVAHKGMQIFHTIVLSVIITPHDVLTPHISKTHLLFPFANLIDAQKSCQGKKEAFHALGVEAQLLPQSLRIY